MVKSDAAQLSSLQQLSGTEKVLVLLIALSVISRVADLVVWKSRKFSAPQHSVCSKQKLEMTIILYFIFCSPRSTFLLQLNIFTQVFHQNTK